MCCGAWQFILVTYFGPPSRMTAGLLQWSGCSENSESQIALSLTTPSELAVVVEIQVIRCIARKHA